MLRTSKPELLLILAMAMMVTVTVSHPSHRTRNREQTETEPDYGDGDYADENRVVAAANAKLQKEKNMEEFVKFLELFYERYMKDHNDDDIEERKGSSGSGFAAAAAPEAADYDGEMMMSDMPAASQQDQPPAPFQFPSSFPKMAGYNMENINISDGNSSYHFQALINRAGNRTFPVSYQSIDQHNQRQREQTKKQRIEQLKSRLQIHLNRTNLTSQVPQETRKEFYDTISTQINSLNATNFNGDQDNLTDDQYSLQKIRSYRPSCDQPMVNDHEMWANETWMNLFFNFDYLPSGRINIATATLRLYQIPQNNGTGNEENCETAATQEDKKLLRVSIFWYIKSKSKPTIRHKVCDTKMVHEGAEYIELNVEAPARVWFKNPQKNLGLSVQVEDQYLRLLKADKYFRGTSCTVGNPQTKPIPHIFHHAVVMAGVHNGTIDSTATAQSINELLLPSIDVCTVETVENATMSPHYKLSASACRMNRMSPETANLINSIKWEQIALHQKEHHTRHHRKDPRNKMMNKLVVITKAELDNLNSKNANNSNASSVTQQRGSIDR